MAFLAAKPSSTTKPIWARMSIGNVRRLSPVVAASRHIGTISTIARGIFQLSYCAASTRNTNSAEAPKIAAVGMPFFDCWYARSVHSKVIPGGKIVLGELFDALERLSRRDPRSGLAHHFGGRIEII